MIYKSQRFLSRKIIEHRNKVRSVYASQEGQDELFNWFHDLGLFRVIGKDDVDARNRAIKKAEELGLLDEQVIRFLISCYFMLPLDSIEKTRLSKEELIEKARTRIDLSDAGNIGETNG